jgi:NADPH:quinone reductase-like Zn-dependent oxidoreductase
MRAVAVSASGKAPAHHTLPRPTAKRNEVLVRVFAASINPVDLAIASGKLGHNLESRYPVVLGRDFAGEVVAAGPDARRFSIGAEVFGFVPVAAPFIQAGSLGEYVAVAEDAAIALKPDGLTALTAACLPLAGTAALMAVDFVEPGPRSVVLIVGATGGVGRYSVALAAARGATVIATGLSDDVEDLVELGASQIVDYRDDVRTAVVTRYPDGIDGLIYLVAASDYNGLSSLVKVGGAIATTVHCADVVALRERGVNAANILAADDPGLIARLGTLASGASLNPKLDHVFTLADAPAALAELARGTARGKFAVEVAGPDSR